MDGGRLDDRRRRCHQPVEPFRLRKHGKGAGIRGTGRDAPDQVQVRPNLVDVAAGSSARRRASSSSMAARGTDAVDTGARSGVEALAAFDARTTRMTA